MKYVLWCIIAFCFGVFVSYVSNFYTFFNIKLQLDVVPVFLSTLTLLLGIYIAVVIQKNVSDKRVEKNILIERLSDLKLIYSKIDTETTTLRTESIIVGLFTTASKLISQLEGITEITCGKKHINDIKIIQKHHFEFKMLATGGKVKEKVYLYDEKSLRVLGSKSEKLVFDVDSLMIKFNKA
jgi:hypothetical protein